MRLPDEVYASRPWRIHEVAPDFDLEDVWALPTPGGRDDFRRLVDLVAGTDFGEASSRAVRMLFALRWSIGGLLGWDDPDGPFATAPSLRERLPADLRDGPPGPTFDALPFTSLYLLEDEWAAEVANRTMHGIMHIGWVPDGAGGHRGEMAVLVRRHGPFSTAYMAAIRPFRHLIVYPALLRQVEREWREPAAGAPAAGAPLAS